MSKPPRYTADDIRAAVADARSFAQVLSSLGLKPAGGNYKHLRLRLEALGIDYSHLKGQRWANGLRVGPKRPLEAYLVSESPFRSSNHNLKGRLIREKIFEGRCSFCGLTEWMGNPIPLELDHVNGRNDDNRIENLRLLCPNCHALTPTYRGRNKGKY